MVELHEESKIKKYIDAIVLAASIYSLAAAPYVIGKVSKNLEKKVECTYTK